MKRPDNRTEPWSTNRQRTLTPKKAIFYCEGCDSNMVPAWTKCSVCRRRCGRRRMKK